MDPKGHKTVAKAKIKIKPKPQDTRTIEEKIKDDHSFEFCPEPNRFFEINEPVRVGNLEDPIVIASYFDGKYYLIEYTTQPPKRPMPGDITEPTRVQGHWPWHRIFKREYNKTQLFNGDNFSFHSYNTHLESIVHRYYSFGIDMDPDYQRGYVWELEDKVKLIDSIFENAKIGLFVFNSRPFSATGPGYEVIDGKQRLSTIIEFMEDRFTYKGLKFSELHPYDRHKFGDLMIEVGDLKEATKEQILKTFLKINRGGKIMDESHIDKVKKLYEKELTNADD
jgi:hypothetical protein